MDYQDPLFPRKEDMAKCNIYKPMYFFYQNGDINHKQNSYYRGQNAQLPIQTSSGLKLMLSNKYCNPFGCPLYALEGQLKQEVISSTIGRKEEKQKCTSVDHHCMQEICFWCLATTKYMPVISFVYILVHYYTQSRNMVLTAYWL